MYEGEGKKRENILVRGRGFRERKRETERTKL